MEERINANETLLKKYKKMIITKRLLLSSTLILVAVVLVLGFYSLRIENKILTETQKANKLSESIYDKLYNKEFSFKEMSRLAIKYKIKHRDVMIAQFIIESNYFNGLSALARNGNNLFGFHKSDLRPSCSDGIIRYNNCDFKRYLTWQECVVDYALYQSHFISRKTASKDAWIKFLGRHYSTNANYEYMLRSVLNYVKEHELDKP